MGSRYFLGVDGGQSSTTAIIGDENGHMLGLGQGGPSNHAGAGEGQAKFVDAIRTSVGAACMQAGLEGWVRFFSSCLGFSGGPADKQLLLGQMFASDHLLVTDDAAIALSGALAGDPGIVVIAGTGSIAFGRNARDVRRAPAAGVIYLATKAEDSGLRAKHCVRLCAGRRAGDRPPPCGPSCWMPPALVT